MLCDKRSVLSITVFAHCRRKTMRLAPHLCVAELRDSRLWLIYLHNMTRYVYFSPTGNTHGQNTHKCKLNSECFNLKLASKTQSHHFRIFKHSVCLCAVRPDRNSLHSVSLTYRIVCIVMWLISLPCVLLSVV